MLDLDESTHFARALGDINDSYLALKPPHKVTVAEGAARSLKIKRPGQAPMNWSAKRTPYMIEPMNCLANRRIREVVFVGPAQSGKTVGLGEGWLAHVVVNDPGDMLMVQMTEGKAREYSRQRIDRMLEHSPDLAALMSINKRDDNTHDKGFRHGMALKIAWPTTTNLSSSSYRYVFLTDYDRMPMDLDGEGDPFTLARARPRTYLSRGKVCVESSPGYRMLDSRWRPSTPHEGPPTAGIVGLYNSGDRRRWYWKCPDCHEAFEAAPGLSLFNLPKNSDLLDEVRTSDLAALAKHHARVVCPHCGSMIEFRWRNMLNDGGRWLRDHQRWVGDEIIGEGSASTLASFWLGGVAAAYNDWESMLLKHLQGLHIYAMTGSEVELQAAVNTDQALPYTPQYVVESSANTSAPEDRKEAELERFVCPEWTRCVVASVDVQGGTNARFVVQVHAVGPHMEQALIDRKEIKLSKRPGMGGEFAPIDPARYPEDWNVLTDQVVRATYRTVLADREIRVRMTVVDSGGEAGATAMAYAWFRRLRKMGLHNRVRLYKGASSPNAPMVRETMQGARNPGEDGDIPVMICNPGLLSDAVDAGLKRGGPGPNYIHFPEWLPQAFFDELSAEQRDAKGKWTQVRKRNEAFDCCRMIRVGMLVLGLDKLQWTTVPDWLKPLAENSETLTTAERREMQARIAEQAVVTDDRPVATRTLRSRPRQAVRSSYVR